MAATNRLPGPLACERPSRGGEAGIVILAATTKFGAAQTHTLHGGTKRLMLVVCATTGGPTVGGVYGPLATGRPAHIVVELSRRQVSGLPTRTLTIDAGVAPAGPHDGGRLSRVKAGDMTLVIAGAGGGAGADQGMGRAGDGGIAPSWNGTAGGAAPNGGAGGGGGTQSVGGVAGGGSDQPGTAGSALTGGQGGGPAGGDGGEGYYGGGGGSGRNDGGSAGAGGGGSSYIHPTLVTPISSLNPVSGRLDGFVTLIEMA